MSRRALFVLCAAAVVLVLLAVLGQRRASTPGPGAQGLLLPGLEARLNDIERLAHTRAGRETVATLERSADGWVVLERGRYRADVSKIREALIALAQARILEPKTANPDFYDRLGVESVDRDSAGGTGLTIEGSDGPVTVIVGASEGDYRYVRLADQAQSHLIDRDPELPGNTAEWLEPGILDIDPSRIREVTITHPDGETVRLSKSAPDQSNLTVHDVPAGRELLYAAVADVTANVLRDLRLEDVERAEARDEAAVVTVFRTFDGLVVTAYGRERDDRGWVDFEARFDPGQAAANTTEAPDAQLDGAAPANGSAQLDPRSEALELAERLGGWRYRIATYQFEQMTRRMEDLLQSASPSD